MGLLPSPDSLTGPTTGAATIPERGSTGTPPPSPLPSKRSHRTDPVAEQPLRKALQGNPREITRRHQSGRTIVPSGQGRPTSKTEIEGRRTARWLHVPIQDGSRRYCPAGPHTFGRGRLLQFRKFRLDNGRWFNRHGTCPLRPTGYKKCRRIHPVRHVIAHPGHHRAYNRDREGGPDRHRQTGHTCTLRLGLGLRRRWLAGQRATGHGQRTGHLPDASPVLARQPGQLGTIGDLRS
jgi:hypothetical protein